jgi:hypothetical protein
MYRLISAMVFNGMNIEQACREVGFRLSRGRALMQNSLFMAELARTEQAHRSGEGPRSLATLVSIRDNPSGDPSAAMASARIKAATVIMGEHRAGGVSVNIHNQNNAMYTPGATWGGGSGGSGQAVSGQPTRGGYILDLREDHELDPSDPGYRPLIDVTPTSQPAPRHASGAAPASRVGPSGSVLPAERPMPAAAPPKPAGPREFTPKEMSSLSSDELIRLANPGWFNK